MSTMTQAEFDAIENRVTANLAVVTGKLDEVESQKWRIFRNKRLIREARVLLDENQRLLRRFRVAP